MEKILDGKIGKDAAASIGAVVGDVVGSSTESSIESTSKDVKPVNNQPSDGDGNNISVPEAIIRRNENRI